MNRAEKARERIIEFLMEIVELKKQIEMVEICRANEPEKIETFRAVIEKKIERLQNGVALNFEIMMKA